MCLFWGNAVRQTVKEQLGKRNITVPQTGICIHHGLGRDLYKRPIPMFIIGAKAQSESEIISALSMISMITALTPITLIN